MRFQLLHVVLAAAALTSVDCGQSKNSGGSSSGSGSGGSGSGGAVVPINGDGGPLQGPLVGQIDGVATKLPALPKLTNVVAVEREDSAAVDFDPVDGATDYRVYPLPSDQDITVNADGSVTVKNAMYRCAGTRQAYDLENDLNANDPTLTADGQPFNWKATAATNPTVGYVFMTPASDRIPVYAVAGYQGIFDDGWRESRSKVYTTDDSVRQSFLKYNWRDDGIVFYVPSAASSATQTIYTSFNGGTFSGDMPPDHGNRYYFTAADTGSHASDSVPPTAAFQVLTATADGAVPLSAVTYLEGDAHVELSPGNERFHRALYQGQGPLWHVEWAGITQPTTLVVEALDSGCPYQGFLSPQHLAAPPHQTFMTLDDLKAASSTGEVFINGQYDSMTMPKAIARSFVNVTPQPHNPADWDWYQGFGPGTDLGTPMPAPYSDCPNQAMNTTCGRWTTSIFDISAFSTDNPNNVQVFTYGTFLGQFWTAFDDWMQDVTGKVRYTALQKATIDPDPTKFLHVTWSVDIVGTGRRYPQLILSDQDPPVQQALANPNQTSLLIQTIQGPSMRLETQAIHGLVNGKQWDVNNQAPGHVFLGDKDDEVIRPTEPLLEHAGMDRLTKFDAYVSSQRLYVFFDGTPAGCTQYPSGYSLTGPVTVTFGDVLYHEAAPDEQVCVQPKPYGFMHVHQCTETKRHFDDLGFKSGVAGPAWDETKLPCGAY